MLRREGGIFLGNEKDSFTSLNNAPTQIRMVAGVGFEPTTFGL